MRRRHRSAFGHDTIVPVRVTGIVTMISKGTEPRRRAIYGITRVDERRNARTAGSFASSARRRVWHRSFSDGVYGGKTHALRAARAFRDELLVSHLPMTRAEYAAIRRKNNRSGVPGVHRRGSDDQTVLGKPVEPAYWIAFWTMPDGKRAIRKFSIGKYGEKTAFEHAKAARKQALALMDGLHANSPRLKRWLQRHAVI